MSSDTGDCEPSYGLRKTLQVLCYLLQMDDNHKMNRLKLIKLLWAADRFHVRRYGKMISVSKYYALPHGPVNSLALDIAAVNNDYLSNKEAACVGKYLTADGHDTAMSLDPGDDYLSEAEKESLKKAYATFGDLDEFELADNISHAYPEWLNAEKELRLGAQNRVEIDGDDFFKNPDKDAYFGEDETILNAAKEIFDERKEISRLPGFIAMV